MKILLEEGLDKIIKEREFKWNFEIEKQGIYGIEITASAKSWQQNFLKLRSFFKDDDLTIKIDEISFPKKSGEKGLFDGEIAWNGNNLKGLKKTNLFLIKLFPGNHTISFLIDQNPKLETIRIFQLKENEIEISYLPKNNYPIEDGDKRQWLTIVLVNLGLKFLKVSASAKEGKQFLFFKKDDTDLKLVINGQNQKNQQSKSHKYWYWCGRVLKGETKEFNQELNFPSGLHYIEFWADRNPEIKNINLRLSFKIFGRIALYQDIEQTNFVNLRKEPERRDENIICQLKEREKVEILEERVIGEWVPFKSYIWHKVKYQEQEGYILSSFVEIEGQEREIIIEKIKQKTKELNLDENLCLALAGCESKYKVYAASKPYNPEDLKIGQGIFQLTGKLLIDLNDPSKFFYSPISNVFNIDQNITAGIKYLKYLYQRYKDNKDRLEKAIAAYNAGPNSVPIKGLLDLSSYEEQTQKLVKCVLENFHTKNWESIILPLVIFFLIFASGFGLSYLNKIDFFEPLVSEKEYLLAQISHFPGVVLEKEKNQIVIFNSKEKIVGRISADRLNLNEIFEIPPDVKGGNSIHLDSNVIEAPQNIFYFLAANSYSCGAQNCTWIFYRYNANKDFLEIIDKDVFGTDVALILSPDFQRLAMISYVHGSACDTGSYLEIFDLKNFQKEEVNKFKDVFYPTTYINSLTWENDEEINLETYHHNCGDLAKKTVERRFIYNLTNKEVKLKSEKILPDS